MSAVVNKNSSIGFAVAGTGSIGVTSVNTNTLAVEGAGVFSFAVGTTTVSASIPVSLQGNFIRLSSEGSNVQCAFGFGTTGPSLTYGSNGTISGTGVITPNATRGGTVFDSTSEHFMVPFIPVNTTATQLWLSCVAKTSGSVEYFFAETQGVK